MKLEKNLAQTSVNKRLSFKLNHFNIQNLSNKNNLKLSFINV